MTACNPLFRDFAGKVPDHGHPRSTQEMTGRKRFGLAGMGELLDIWSEHMLDVREMRQLFGKLDHMTHERPVSFVNSVERFCDQILEYFWLLISTFLSSP